MSIDQPHTDKPQLLRLLAFLSPAHTGIGTLIAVAMLAAVILITIFSPWIAPHDPLSMDPLNRLKPPSEDYLLGTDGYGRDLFSRMILGGRISLLIGIFAAVVALVMGVVIGLIAGYFRLADALIMRAMDALMAMPSILIAVALVALNGPSIGSVIAAITIPEVPRVVRLVRSVVLSVREEPYVEAATALGSSTPKILFQHLLPNTMAPMIVQGTYIVASAILTEALLSFLGAGISTEIPTWGNIMAEGRQYFRINPGIILWPGLLLTICVLSINLIGDAARDALDPRMKKREA
ncbi:peptide/nickel transport system permease protein [Paracoccus alcaliphilus]|uniref:Peptide/nickel transport system permease protein n=1 Tax=Paracoccus alcaliphilus TaxID=34002 RepID=A0A1H8MBA1_9RHOB|nr:ABC transporter permease [Paracoccus alcaliphilus]WCR20629.1 ABC transporter permease [Paracoccus alcaliphilus]SEO14560.1 peptide/nickel transport system permease protein [Paracoccus alcaliphilus]